MRTVDAGSKPMTVADYQKSIASYRKTVADTAARASEAPVSV
jgi:hypothetical protein